METDSRCPLSASYASWPWGQTNLLDDVSPGQLNSLRKKEKVVLGDFNFEIREGQQKKKTKKKTTPNNQQVNETKPALLGREGTSLPASFHSTGRVGPKASWLGRCLAAGEAEAIKVTYGCQRLLSKARKPQEGPCPPEAPLWCHAVPGRFLGSFAGFDILVVDLPGFPPLRLGPGELSAHLRLSSPKIRRPQIRVTSSYARGP